MMKRGSLRSGDDEVAVPSVLMKGKRLGARKKILTTDFNTINQNIRNLSINSLRSVNDGFWDDFSEVV